MFIAEQSCSIIFFPSGFGKCSQYFSSKRSRQCLNRCQEKGGLHSLHLPCGSKDELQLSLTVYFCRQRNRTLNFIQSFFPLTLEYIYIILANILGGGKKTNKNSWIPMSVVISTFSEASEHLFPSVHIKSRFLQIYTKSRDVTWILLDFCIPNVFPIQHRFSSSHCAPGLSFILSSTQQIPLNIRTLPFYKINKSPNFYDIYSG